MQSAQDACQTCDCHLPGTRDDSNIGLVKGECIGNNDTVLPPGMVSLIFIVRICNIIPRLFLGYLSAMRLSPTGYQGRSWCWTSEITWGKIVMTVLTFLKRLDDSCKPYASHLHGYREDHNIGHRANAWVKALQGRISLSRRICLEDWIFAFDRFEPTWIC